MKRFSNIVFVATSGADDSAAFSQAVALANNNQAKFTVVGLVDALGKQKTGASSLARRLMDAMVEQRGNDLQTLVDSASTTGPKIEVKVLIGKGFIEIIREVLRHKRDLVIKCVENTEEAGKQIFGSTDMKLMRKCPCPLWLIKPTQQQGFREILAAVDYDLEDAQVDALNGQILEMATSLAVSEFAELHIVHAWRLAHESVLRSPRLGFSSDEVDAMVQEEEGTRGRWLESLMNKHCAAQGNEVVDYVKPESHLIKGIASQVVPALAIELGVELIVMGTVGRTGIPGLLIGNTAETILGQIDCSVLTVKPAGFVSPVTLVQ
jgi:nucleotide-binding universal stress UspA family protein